MTKNRPVSIVVPSYNSAATIEDCVGSILQNTYRYFELIIVDDRSTDGSAGYIRSFHDKRIRLIMSRKNMGPAGARNLGIQACRHDLVLLTDADSIVPQDWIEKHIRAHRDAGVGMVSGSVSGMHHTVFGQADDFCNWWTSIPGSRACAIRSLHVPALNLSAKKSVFERAGLFNPKLRCGEDSEFTHRALRRGIRIQFDPAIVVRHYDRDSLKDFKNHHYTWGLYTAKNRVNNRLEHHWLLPESYAAAVLLSIPLAAVFTCFIILRWLPYKPAVVLYSPLIFAAKVQQSKGMIDSYRK